MTTSNVAVASAIQRLEVGQTIQLFSIDLSPLGGGIQYWTPNRAPVGQSIIFNGNTYAYVDVVAEGFERTVQGTMPTPNLTIGNADNAISAIMALYEDILGCVVTRQKTLAEFLDGQPGADPTAVTGLDIYRIERKLLETKQEVKFELSSIIDQEGTQLPFQVMQRDQCPYVYRRWNGSAFDYSNVFACPYTGSAYFDQNGNACAAAQDACGHRVSDCKLRFGANAELPYGGFPGLARVRTS